MRFNEAFLDAMASGTPGVAVTLNNEQTIKFHPQKATITMLLSTSVWGDQHMMTFSIYMYIHRYTLVVLRIYRLGMASKPVI